MNEIHVMKGLKTILEQSTLPGEGVSHENVGERFIQLGEGS